VVGRMAAVEGRTAEVGRMAGEAGTGK